MGTGVSSALLSLSFLNTIHLHIFSDKLSNPSWTSPRPIKIFSSYFFLALLLVWVVFSINSDEISILHLQCFVLFSCCSIFNDQFLCRLFRDSPSIIPHTSSLVNTFFGFFLKNFSRKKYASHIWVAFAILVGRQGLEPRTNRLWAGCSNQLS